MDAQRLAMASLKPGVEESGNFDFAPSSANKDDGEPNATAGTDEFHHQHPSSASFLPIVTPTDDTKEMIQEQPTTIDPPTLSISDHSNVASPTSLTKQALRPPPASIFPPPSAAAATAASSYHHPHADGRNNLGVAIKASASMYGSLSPNAGKCRVHGIASPHLISFVLTHIFRIPLFCNCYLRSYKDCPLDPRSSQNDWHQASRRRVVCLVLFVVLGTGISDFGQAQQVREAPA